MSLADDLNAPPLARRVAEIIKDHAARLELGPDWADAAAVRVLVEVTRPVAVSASVSNGEGSTGAPPLDAEACYCLGLAHRDSCPGWVLPW